MSDAKEALLERLRTARAKAAEHEEQLAAREELRQLEEQAVAAENRARDLPHIQAAEDEHGKIAVVNTRLGAIVVRKPHHLAYQQFTRRAADSKPLDDAAMWRLVKACVVYPTVQRAEEIVEEYAGVTARLAEEVVRLAKGEVDETEGK